MKKVFFLTPLLLFFACDEQFNSQIELVSDSVTYHLSNLSMIDVQIEKGRSYQAPDDQDTLYVEFRNDQKGISGNTHRFKVSPIQDSHSFKVPVSHTGYYIFACTYPDKYNGFKESWDLKKHLWSWNHREYGPTGLEKNINVKMKRHSSNLILRLKEGTTMPEDITRIYITCDVVFDNYFPVWDYHAGLYKRKIFTFNKGKGNFEFQNKCMSLSIPDNPGGDIMITIYNELPGGPHVYFYEDILKLMPGQTTIVNFDFEKLSRTNYSANIDWLDNEEIHTIDIGG